MNGIAHPTPAQSAGGEAEERAAAYLAGQGLRILARNYRTRAGEIDLIANDAGTLVFVEVRLRRHGAFGGPLESITARKRARIVSAARHYLMRIKRVPPCRFDVVSLDGDATRWMRGAFDAS